MIYGEKRLRDDTASQRFVSSFRTIVTKDHDWRHGMRQSENRAQVRKWVSGEIHDAAQRFRTWGYCLTADIQGWRQRFSLSSRPRNMFYPCITPGASPCAAKTYNSCLLCLVHARNFRLSNRGFWIIAARESKGPWDLVNPGFVSPLRNRADSTVEEAKRDAVDGQSKVIPRPPSLIMG